MAITNDSSTNPVGQSTTQDSKINLNDVNPVKPTEDNLNFDINLDEAIVDASSEIDINKKVENTLDENVEIKETKVGKKKDDLLNFPDSYFAEKKEEAETILEPKEKPEIFVKEPNEDKTLSDNNSWLQAQDQQNKEEEKSLFDHKDTQDTTNQININAPVIDKIADEITPEAMTQINELKENISKIEPTINIDINQTKSETFDIWKTDYTSDMKIIENISETKPIEQKTNLDVAPIVYQTETNKQKNIDLDSLIATNETEKIESNGSDVNMDTKANELSIDSLYPNVEQSNNNVKAEDINIEQIKPTIDINAPVNAMAGLGITKWISKMRNNHLLKFLLPAGWIVILAVLIYFVWATMYPMESQNVISDEIPQVNEVAVETWLDLTWDIVVVDTWNTSGEIIAEGDIINSGDIHWASPEFDSLWELTEDIASQDQIETLSMVDKLRALSNEANTFLVEWQSNNNKIYIKYGWTIAKKCGELISMLENNQEIDNLSGNLAQLEGYLQKLREIKNAWNQQSSGLLQETNNQSWQQASTINASAIAE